MAVKGNIGNISGVVGQVKTDINTYKGVESESTKVTVDNYRKEIKVDIKPEFIKEQVKDKQDKLIAGENITIDENNVISATGGGGGGSEVIPNPPVTEDTPLLTSVEIDGEKFKINNEGKTYHEGEGIIIDNENNISVDKTVIQEKLTAGENVTIENGIISATDTTYTAGENITIENGVISAQGGSGDTIAAGNGITITVESDDTKTINVDTTQIQEKLVSGQNIKTINDQTLLGEGNLVIQGSEPFIYNEVLEGGNQELILPKNTVTIYKNTNLTKLTINFAEDYRQRAGWISEVAFRNNNNPTLIINPLNEDIQIKYIQFGRNASAPSHLSTNATIDLIFYYDGISTICYVSEVLDNPN